MPRASVASAGNVVKRHIRTALYGSSFFFPIRNAYQRIFDRQRLVERSEMREFYSQFFRKGDLVFDVGANVGEYSEMFSSLGVRVVAIEPNPSCCNSLYKLARIRDVKVEGCAVGASAGNATLRICDESAFSTLSDRWFKQSKESRAHQDVKWLTTIDVPVTTLDALAQRHGMPTYIKIDVEGYEERVLAGMSFRPSFLSFEFNVLAKEAASLCLERLGSSYEFNAIVGRQFAFCQSQWMTFKEAMAWLASRKQQFEYGDIFARRLE